MSAEVFFPNKITFRAFRDSEVDILGGPFFSLSSSPLQKTKFADPVPGGQGSHSQTGQRHPLVLPSGGPSAHPASTCGPHRVLRSVKTLLGLPVCSSPLPYFSLQRDIMQLHQHLQHFLSCFCLPLGPVLSSGTERTNTVFSTHVLFSGVGSCLHLFCQARWLLQMSSEGCAHPLGAKTLSRHRTELRANSQPLGGEELCSPSLT